MYTPEEFAAKMEWEGGMAEFILGYGVNPEEVPDAVASKITAFIQAANELEGALQDWGVFEYY